jgi:hypothetical protein
MTWSRAVGGLVAGADAADAGPAAGGGSATGCGRPQPTAATAAASTAPTASRGRGRFRPAIEHGGTTVRLQVRNKCGINRMLSIGHIHGF